MSNLIKRFKEDLQLAGYAKRSIDSYVSAVLRLQRFHNKPLENLSEEQLRQYRLCCQSEFGWSAATLRISYAGIQYFLPKHWFDPRTFSTRLNGSVNRPYQLF